MNYNDPVCDPAEITEPVLLDLMETPAMQRARRGLQIGVLTEDDLWGTDRPAWEKLQASRDIIISSTRAGRLSS